MCEYGQVPRSPASSSSGGQHLGFDAKSGFDSLDLVLMHRFATVTALELFPAREAQHCWQYVVPKWAEDHNFLMHGLLALAGMDLARVTPEKRVLYRTRALHHQQAGLLIFQEVLSRESAAHIEAIFMFSVILIILAFASPQTEDEVPSVDGILDLFALFRGPRTLATAYWPTIKGQVIEPLVGPRNDNPPTDLPKYISTYFTDLKFELEEPHRAAWDRLTENIARSLESQDLRAVGNWPATLHDEFFSRMRAHDPVALIVLAQFSIVVRKFQSRWWLWKWDRMLLQAVDNALSEEEKRRFDWHPEKLQDLLESIS